MKDCQALRRYYGESSATGGLITDGTPKSHPGRRYRRPFTHEVVAKAVCTILFAFAASVNSSLVTRVPPCGGEGVLSLCRSRLRSPISRLESLAPRSGRRVGIGTLYHVYKSWTKYRRFV